MSRTVALISALALSGCAAYDAHRARTDLVGTNVIDMQACAGVPAKATQVSDTTWLLSYDYKATSEPALSVKVLSALDLSIGAKGGCSMTVRLAEPGYVQAVHFAGDETTTAGPQAGCGPLVRECVDHADRTRLPAGFTMARWLSGRGAGKW